MDILNNTPLIILFFSLITLCVIITPLIVSLVLRLFSRLFRFPKNDFKTALYCNLIILGIIVVISSSLNILFFDQIEKLSSIFTLFSLVVSLIVGTYVVHRFYGAPIFKSFLALFLTGLIMFIVLIFVIIVAGLIFGPFLVK